MKKTAVRIRRMTMADYPAVRELWLATPGMFNETDDSRAAITRQLRRNPGLSFVAFSGGRCVAAVLGAHDARRGYLHHVAVASDFQRRGLGTKIWQRALAALGRAGIRRAHVFVRLTNKGGMEFWKRAGWMRRTDLAVFSHNPQP